MARSLMENEFRLLGILATSEKGQALGPGPRREAAILVRRGFVWWFEAVGLRVYQATEEGKKFYEDQWTDAPCIHCIKRPPRQTRVRKGYEKHAICNSCLSQ